MPLIWNKQVISNVNEHPTQLHILWFNYEERTYELPNFLIHLTMFNSNCLIRIVHHSMDHCYVIFLTSEHKKKLEPKVQTAFTVIVIYIPLGVIGLGQRLVWWQTPKMKYQSLFYHLTHLLCENGIKIVLNPKIPEGCLPP